MHVPSSPLDILPKSLDTKEKEDISLYFLFFHIIFFPTTFPFLKLDILPKQTSPLLPRG